MQLAKGRDTGAGCDLAYVTQRDPTIGLSPCFGFGFARRESVPVALVGQEPLFHDGLELPTSDGHSPPPGEGLGLQHVFPWKAARRLDANS